MKRLIPIITIILLFTFLLGLRASAQPIGRHHLPTIRNGAQPPDSLVVLDNGDNTFVSAALSPGGCVFLSYIDRDDGNRLIVVQDAGDHLVDVKLPTIVRAAPSFVAPGDKQADGTLLIVNGQLILYFTSRDAQGEPFKLKRFTMPLPGCV